MTAALKPYPAYKDSGVEWLGEVPEHWGVERLGAIGRLFKGNGGTKEDEVSVGIPCVRYGDIYMHHQFFVRESRSCVSAERAPDYTPLRFGDVLFAGSGETIDEIGKSVACLIESAACCGGDVIVFRPSIELNAEFMGYAAGCRQAAIQKSRMGRGITVMHVYADQLKNLRVLLPPMSDQTAVVRYLNYMDRRIARYIQAKQKLIKLLEEQKQVIVHQAVTGQIDVRTGKPYPAYKESGAEWFEQVPESWQVRKLRSLFRRHGSGTTPAGDHYYGGGVPWVMTGDLSDDAIETTKRTVTAGALDDVRALRMYPPDSLVVAMYGATIGKTGILTMDACTNQACCVLSEPNPSTNPRYFQFVVNLARSHLIQQSYGGGQPNINAEIVRSLRVPVPSRQEQDRIVDVMCRDDVAHAVDRAQREMKLVREYRTRLIADVVTGKLDVRDAAANLPDETEETGLAVEKELPPDDREGDELEEELALQETEA